jgi:hypothetical protein
MPTANVSLFCPAMKFTRIDRDTFMTAYEPMRATITFSEGGVLVVENVGIQPTPVRKVTELHWKVDPCTGEGTDAAGNSVLVSLPFEYVVFEFWELSMVAKAILCGFDLALVGGAKWRGYVLLPDCRTSLLTHTAEAITGTGTIQLQ